MGCGHRAPCCAVASDIYVISTYKDIIALKWSARRVQPRGCCAQQLRSNYQAGTGYFGTTMPIIRLVVDLIIRLVVDPIIRVVLYYQPKADNPADNPAVSFVVYTYRATGVPSEYMVYATSI